MNRSDALETISQACITREIVMFQELNLHEYKRGGTCISTFFFDI
jgi:hypothetical protein